MDIAAQDDDAGLLEPDDPGFVLAVEFQLEGLGRRERIDVMPERVAIGEGHIGADRNDQDERLELHVPLGHHIGPRKADRRAACESLRLHGDDGVRDRLAAWRHQAHDEVARPRRRGEDAGQQNACRQTHAYPVALRREAAVNHAESTIFRLRVLGFALGGAVWCNRSITDLHGPRRASIFESQRP